MQGTESRRASWTSIADVGHGRRIYTSRLAWIGGAALAGFLVPAFALRVLNWGHAIPAPDIQSDYVIAWLWALALGATILIWPVSRRDRNALIVLWSVKCAVTLGLMLLYENVYTVLDAYGYLTAALAPRYDWQSVGFGSGTQNLEAMTWLHGQYITASYHAIKVSFAAVGLLGTYVFYRGVVHATAREDLRILFLLALFPSILFWSSILGKDPIVYFGICLYAYGVMGWSRHGRWRYLVPILLGIAVASMIRLWAGPILLAPLSVFALKAIRGWFGKISFLVLSMAAMVLMVAQFAEMFGLEAMQDVYSRTETFSEGWGGGSGLSSDIQLTSLRGLLIFAPLGAFTALFRPLPGEVMNPFGLLAGAESALLLGLFGLALVRFRWSVLRQPLILWAVSLVVVWSTLYGFISFQNLGSAVRFKLQILPVLLCLLLYLSSKRPVPLPREERRTRSRF
jgi:hypothetical protein